MSDADYTIATKAGNDAVCKKQTGSDADCNKLNRKWHRLEEKNR